MTSWPLFDLVATPQGMVDVSHRRQPLAEAGHKRRPEFDPTMLARLAPNRPGVGAGYVSRRRRSR